MSHLIRPLALSDYPAVHSLWEASPGIGLGASDTEPAIRSFLERNPGLSAVATVDSEVVGAVLCGHDGRRGSLHHLAVSEAYRGQGIGRDLVDWCLSRLTSCGIVKCNVFLFKTNEVGAAFWSRVEWTPRPDIQLLQKSLGPG